MGNVPWKNHRHKKHLRSSQGSIAALRLVSVRLASASQAPAKGFSAMAFLPWDSTVVTSKSPKKLNALLSIWYSICLNFISYFCLCQILFREMFHTLLGWLTDDPFFGIIYGEIVVTWAMIFPGWCMCNPETTNKHVGSTNKQNQDSMNNRNSSILHQA